MLYRKNMLLHVEGLVLCLNIVSMWMLFIIIMFIIESYRFFKSSLCLNTVPNTKQFRLQERIYVHDILVWALIIIPEFISCPWKHIFHFENQSRVFATTPLLGTQNDINSTIWNIIDFPGKGKKVYESKKILFFLHLRSHTHWPKQIITCTRHFLWTG